MPNTYTNNTPQATQKVADTQPLILQNFAYLQNVIGKEHNFTATDTTALAGTHKFVNMPNGAAPAFNVDGGDLTVYANNDNLFSVNSSTQSTQLTGHIPTIPINSASSVVNMGAYWMMGGIVTVTGNSTTVSFGGTPFTGGVLSIQVTPVKQNALAQGDRFSIEGQNTAGFNIQTTGYAPPNQFYWMAVGTS